MSTGTTQNGADVTDEHGIRQLAPINDRPLRSVPTTDSYESDAASRIRALFITPTRWGEGFTASIHGHTLTLADPRDHRLAPSPDDLLVASIASDFAWCARRLLRANGLPDDVSVSARWQSTDGQPSLADIALTVRVSARANVASPALAAAFANTVAARSLAELVVHISLEGGHR